MNQAKLLNKFRNIQKAVLNASTFLFKNHLLEHIETQMWVTNPILVACLMLRLEMQTMSAELCQS